ncbi:P22 phage major capsid protein family protein [Leifsonia aquatica]|jgi:hypothetical protein|uniref:P22 phage major capsid protein family protein n=1 Tax=Leifsonia aquatica TaxID=144185 RepID=UPI00382ADDD9
MANEILTPSKIAQAALATLYEVTIGAQLVHRDYDTEFVAKVGDTITVRKPAVFEAKEYDPATGIEIQDAKENGVPVTLNHFADTSFAVTAKDLTLKLENFREQLLDPAMESIAQKIDRDLFKEFRAGITQSVGVKAGREWNKPEALIDAGTILNVNSVPTTDRHAVVGPQTNGEWLDAPILKQANTSGSTEALREAYVGRRLFGFDPYWSQHIEQPATNPAVGQPTTEVGVAFHRTAVALVTRQLELPMGATNAAIASYKGFGVRVVIGYDQKFKKDVVSIDTLYGIKVLDAKRAVLIKGADKAA